MLAKQVGLSVKIRVVGQQSTPFTGCDMLDWVKTEIANIRMYTVPASIFFAIMCISRTN
jgi:hypothetical protein